MLDFINTDSAIIMMFFVSMLACFLIMQVINLLISINSKLAAIEKHNELMRIVASGGYDRVSANKIKENRFYQQ